MSLLPRSKPLRALVISCASFVLALGAAELYLRIAAPVRYRAPLDASTDTDWRTLVHRRSEVPGLLYELAPNVAKDVRGMHVETNALGLRGRMPEMPKPANMFRIAAIGDSVTFGFSVAAEEAWSTVLETRLAETAAQGAPRVEVVNFGVGGYCTRDEALVLEHKALPLAPDLVIVAYFLNDPDYEPQLQPLHRYFRGSLWWEHSHVARLVARWRFDRERAAAGDDLYRWYHAPDSERWKSVLDAFDAMQSSVDAAGIPLVLVVFPCYRGFPGFDHYRWTELHERVLAAAKARGFVTLDLLPTFAASERTQEELSADPEHPSALGHALAARAIAERVAEFVRVR
ncbi:MAG: SGNH/GDSL hydrolase family protein [Planctomycetes bacterium]|nr:SGNH/GDSL hydrolase family protein [Planctomycetota bacterium]